MRVAVEHGSDRKAIQRFLEAAAAEERIDLEGLTFDRCLNGGVVEDGDQSFGAETRQRRFELQRLVQAFVDELLNDLLAPGAERTPSESSSLRPAGPTRSRDCRARRPSES